MFSKNPNEERAPLRTFFADGHNSNMFVVFLFLFFTFCLPEFVYACGWPTLQLVGGIGGWLLVFHGVTAVLWMVALVRWIPKDQTKSFPLLRCSVKNGMQILVFVTTIMIVFAAVALGSSSFFQEVTPAKMAVEDPRSYLLLLLAMLWLSPKGICAPERYRKVLSIACVAAIFGFSLVLYVQTSTFFLQYELHDPFSGLESFPAMRYDQQR